MALEIRVTFWNGYYLDLEHILRMQTFLMVHWFLIIFPYTIDSFQYILTYILTSWHYWQYQYMISRIFYNPILPAVIGFINFHPIIDHELLKIVLTNIILSYDIQRIRRENIRNVVYIYYFCETSFA